MQLGKLNRRVTLQTLTETPNGSGGFDQVWTDAGTIQCEAVPIGGPEALVAGRLATSTSWRIRMRHRALTATHHRLKLEGKVLNIVSSEDPDGRRRSLVVMAEYQAVAG